MAIGGDMEETKQINVASYYGAPNGKSFYLTKCPFCGKASVIYTWGGYKNCDCGARLNVHNMTAKKTEGKDE